MTQQGRENSHASHCGVGLLATGIMITRRQNAASVSIDLESNAIVKPESEAPKSKVPKSRPIGLGLTLKSHGTASYEHCPFFQKYAPDQTIPT